MLSIDPAYKYRPRPSRLEVYIVIEMVVRKTKTLRWFQSGHIGVRLP